MKTLKTALTESLKEIVAELDATGHPEEADSLIHTYFEAIRLAQNTNMQPAGPTNQVGAAIPTAMATVSQPGSAAPPSAPSGDTSRRTMSRMQEMKVMEKAMRQMKSASSTLISDAETYYANTRDKVQKWRNFLRSEDFKMGLEAFRDANGLPTMKSAYNAYMQSNDLKQDYAQSGGGGGFQMGASKPVGF